MGFRMEKFGAEEMEVKLFLFAVLQICLLSPWGHRERPALAVHRGTGSWRGSGCFISTLRTPSLGLVKEPCAGGQEALVSRVQHGLLLCWRASGWASCRLIHSVTDCGYPSAVLQHAGVPVKGEESKRGLAADYIQALCQGLTARAVQEPLCPACHALGTLG